MAVQTQTATMRIRLLAMKIACAGLLATLPAEAGITIGVSLGKASTLDSDVDLSMPIDTDLTFRDVSWADESFTGPIYYDLRLMYWMRRSTSWGFGVDVIHAKMLAKLDKPVRVSGRREGEAVAHSEPLVDTFDVLSFTHGHNLITLNGSYRWFVGNGPGEEGSRWRPYTGLGVGVTLPHVEVTTAGNETYEYQLAGPAGQGYLGAEISLNGRVSLCGEYKLSWAEMQAELVNGGRVEVRPWSHHLLAGLAFSF